MNFNVSFGPAAPADTNIRASGIEPQPVALNGNDPVQVFTVSLGKGVGNRRQIGEARAAKLGNLGFVETASARRRSAPFSSKVRLSGFSIVNPSLRSRSCPSRPYSGASPDLMLIPFRPTRDVVRQLMESEQAFIA